MMNFFRLGVESLNTSIVHPRRRTLVGFIFSCLACPVRPLSAIHAATEVVGIGVWQNCFVMLSIWCYGRSGAVYLWSLLFRPKCK